MMDLSKPDALCVYCGADLAALHAELARLRADQLDWRKGVALIASALGEKDPPDLSCVRISEVALTIRARLALTEKVVSAADRVATEVFGYEPYDKAMNDLVDALHACPPREEGE